MGAAYLAGLAVGYWKDKEEVLRNRRVDRNFMPAMEHEAREALIRDWNRAVACARGWAR